MDQLLNDYYRAFDCTGILITDGEGIVIQVEERFNDTYGLPPETLVGKSVFDLEKEKVFNPSIAAIVIRTKEDATVVQELQNGQKVIVTAFPILDDAGDIKKVVTFTRGIDEYIAYINRYEELNRKIDLCNRNLNDVGFIFEDDTQDIITTNKEFQQAIENIKKAAQYDVSIVIEGETGVGKSLLARKCHSMSKFSGGKFVEINCSALPESLIESELFGYEKGAFTGADKDGKPGLIEVAANGTLFLDEVSDLPLASQGKLLQVLQQKIIRRVGGTKDIEVTCRFIAATNKDLEKEVEKKNFREDLWYRINTVSCEIPPLRQRRDDIIPLSKELLSEANKKHGTNKMFSNSALRCLTNYSWPGNVRELENMVSRLVIISPNNLITQEDLPNYISEASVECGSPKKEDVDILNITDLKVALEGYEAEIIKAFYEKKGSSVNLAKALNISQSSAARKIRKYVTRDQQDDEC